MLKITAQMASPICGEIPQFDALLEFEMAQRQGVAQKLRRELPAPPQGAVHIPMVRRRLGPWEVGCCSAPIARQRAEFKEHKAKRLATERAELLQASQRLVVATGNATYKSYRLPQRVRDFERIVWLVWGHRRPIKSLLRSVRSLGMDRSVGYGRVESWVLEEVPGEEWWYAPSAAGTVLMRPLPYGPWLPKDLIGYRRDFGACCAPYWHPDRYGEIVVPC